MLLAGFGKIDMTPDYPIGLGGYSNADKRISEEIDSRIYAICVALRDGEETVLLFSVDNCGFGYEMADRLRAPVMEATGLAGEKIFVMATHSHNCPGLGGHDQADKYVAFLGQQMAKCAQMALEDCAPAVTMATKKFFPGMNATRHVQMADGTVAGSDWRRRDSYPIGNAGTPDSQMVLYKFVREGKRDILMINWQGHPDGGNQFGLLRISPSFVGPLRDTVEAGSGMHVVYFTGADGNMTINSRIDQFKYHNLSYRRYGVKMGTLALELSDEMVEVTGEGIATTRAYVDAPVDHSWDHMLPQAQEVYDLFKKTDRPTADVLGRKYNFSSCYQARAIISRSKMGPTRTMELNAVRIGGVGIAVGTYEMFSESGLEIKGGSPYEYTMVMTSNSSYMPSRRAYANRCYESDTGFYAEGTAEMMVEKYLEMLRSIQ